MSFTMEGLQRMLLESLILEAGLGLEAQHHPIGLTALLYLKEALETEDYEDCHLCVEIAREFGAEKWEVQNLIDLFYEE